MAGPVIGQREWTCPDCAQVLPIVMTMQVRYDENRHPRHVVAIDNADIQAHTLMHEICLCAWEVVEARTLAGGTVLRHGLREPHEDCTIHRERCEEGP